jgi:hypothetical protein
MTWLSSSAYRVCLLHHIKFVITHIYLSSGSFLKRRKEQVPPSTEDFREQGSPIFLSLFAGEFKGSVTATKNDETGDIRRYKLTASAIRRAEFHDKTREKGFDLGRSPSERESPLNRCAIRKPTRIHRHRRSIAIEKETRAQSIF